jgi:1-pyrroline-5-carboxylate dehydrogenase
MTAEAGFKLTYATMSNPSEAMHACFEEALVQVRARLGHEHGLFIDGREFFIAEKFEDRSPVDTNVVLGIFRKGGAQKAAAALVFGFRLSLRADLVNALERLRRASCY